MDSPPTWAMAKQVRLFSVAVSKDPGLIVGRHLLSLGHRTIAFISPQHDTPWSRLRLEGLIDAFKQVRCPNGVVPFVIEKSVLTHQLVEEASRQSTFAVLQKKYTDWRKSIPPEYHIDFDYAFEELRWTTCLKAETRRRLAWLFEKALTDRNITAWVLVNDLTTSMAMDYLAQRGVNIPDDLSVISFDDTSEALRKGYSSFNFNPTAIAEAMIGFLLNRKPYTDPCYRVSGYLVNRGTTAIARKIPPPPYAQTD